MRDPYEVLGIRAVQVKTRSKRLTVPSASAGTLT